MANTTATIAVRLTMQGASQLVAGAHGVVGAFSKVKDTLGGVNQQAFYFIANARSIASSLGSLGNALIQPNVRFEQFEEQLSFIPSIAGEAKSELKKMYDTANQEGMPFEDMARMALALHRLGGASIAGADDLGLWIRAAKLTGRTGEQMGMEIGELFNILERGDDPSKQLKGLSNASLISPKAYQEVMQLIEAKSDASTIFDHVRDAIAESTRRVGLFGTTWGDATNRMSNQWNEFKRQLGEGLFNAVKGDLDEMTNQVEALFASGRIAAWAENAGAKIKAIYEQLTNASLSGVNLGDLLAAAEQGRLGELLRGMLSMAAQNFWEEMRYGAAKYGPDIQRALIPEKLHGLAGLNAEVDEKRNAIALALQGKGTEQSNAMAAKALINPYFLLSSWWQGDSKPLLPPKLKSMEDTQLLADIRDPWKQQLLNTAALFAGKPQPSPFSVNPDWYFNDVAQSPASRAVSSLITGWEPTEFMGQPGYMQRGPEGTPGKVISADEFDDVKKKLESTAQKLDSAAGSLQSAASSFAAGARF